MLGIILAVYFVFLSMFHILYAELELTSAAAEAAAETADAGYLFKHLDELLETEAKKVGEKAEKQWEGAAELEEYAYAFVRDLAYGKASEQWFRAVVKKRLSYPELIERVVEDGYDGVEFGGSDMYAEDEMTVLCLSYRVKFPVLQELLPAMRFRKTVFVRSFSGEGSLWESVADAGEESETEEGYVYVTKTGTVYHRDRGCTYISLKVKRLSYGKLPEERNRYGAKYYPCESCASGKAAGEVVWITESGNRYHLEESCSKLKRTVTKLKESEAGDYRPCSRCGGEEALPQ